MGTDCMCNLLDSTQIALSLQISDNLFSGFITIQASIFAAKLIDGTIIIHHINLRQIMSLTNLKVIRIMGRCNLNSTCSLFLVCM